MKGSSYLLAVETPSVRKERRPHLTKCCYCDKIILTQKALSNKVERNGLGVRC